MVMSDTDVPFWSRQSFMTVTPAIACFLAGIIIGRKLSNTMRRVASLASVGPTKLALVVRADLKMGKGKVAAQCSHGTLAAYKQIQKSNPRVLQAWEDAGQPKIVVSAKDLDHFNTLMEMAAVAGVPTATVQDAGRTQVVIGSQTVLAVGPAPIADVDKITGNLRLL
ncbi:peptidyl-tRNA hydrolase 2, mitochondrial-like [Homarus americanus]|uniref:peptidyl-tRNA hydrolase n=1 Tax=Homarus americanus TaxID=6706 RepID=A0A8J5JK06_HOMAM|nr:peptidyl-tRNA hydrolase 2, mitochondrial-like [Homarus americanus]KAG7157015.1 Peptidyl-tRNA hydrolase 2-like 2 [Homarus americanus]